MGLESFRIELRGGRVGCHELNETLSAYPHVSSDQTSPPTQGSTFYLLKDGLHVFEIEAMDAPVRLSCRFTLCHPPSVDAAFLGFVRELMCRLGMQVRICDDVRPQDARPFKLEEIAEFSPILSRYIAARRAEWIAAFGPVQSSATTNEVHERYILPRCQASLVPPTYSSPTK